MKQLRDYQVEGALKGADILRRYNILYMAWSVRTGKSATSMEVARLFGAKKVIFLTKKKAIDSIREDYNSFGFNKYFYVEIWNNESMHKILDNDFDLAITPCKVRYTGRFSACDDPPTYGVYYYLLICTETAIFGQ